jgi:hypothetical protein
MKKPSTKASRRRGKMQDGQLTIGLDSVIGRASAAS